MIDLFKENLVEYQDIIHPDLNKSNISLTIARLDKLHPIVSGNKLFKLHFFLKEAIDKQKNLLTFGGAYSNHLVATAYAAMVLGVKAIGIVRGEKPKMESNTLTMCRQYGMELQFLSRTEYRKYNQPLFFIEIEKEYPNYIIIPEGGFHPLGAEGASLIMDKVQNKTPTHICLPVGTATTLAGILSSANEDQHVLGFPVLKNMTDINTRIAALIDEKHINKLDIIDGYHFGGYAKSTKELTTFMNEFYQQYNIPLDFVYTGKMMFGVIEKMKQHYFPRGSRILCLHTGGLQGNVSLLKNTLIY